MAFIIVLFNPCRVSRSPVEMMGDMQKNPEERQKWNEDFAKKFAALPED